MKKILGILFLTISIPAFSASFDCKKASTSTEKSICADVLLSIQDEVMATSYQKTISYKGNPASYINEIKKNHAKWRTNSRDHCKDDMNCLHDAYDLEIADLVGIESRESVNKIIKNKGWTPLKMGVVDDEDDLNFVDTFTNGKTKIGVVYYRNSKTFVSIRYE